MNSTRLLTAFLVGTCAASSADCYEEASSATSANLFFARVEQPTDLSLSTTAEAGRLVAACKSGQRYRVETQSTTCTCSAEPAEGYRTDTATVTMHCPPSKGMPPNGALVLVSHPDLKLDDTPFDDTRPLGSTDARTALAYLLSVDPGLRKPASVLVYALRAPGQQILLAHTETETHDEAGCTRRRFKVIKKRGDLLELAGEAYDVTSLIEIQPGATLLLRSSNQCDGVQASLYDLIPKVGFRADFSGH